ncbi:MAG: PorT family protein [Bacteroidales bacterium]|nr:PorT family protein [Bacteroidales bacterium]
MKRLLHLILFIFVFSLVSFGQLKGGLKGGVNFCDLIVSKSGDLFSDQSFKGKTSYHIGTYVQKSFNDQLAWQIEVLFSNKGYINEHEGQKTNVSLNYINWPIFIVYRPIELLEFELGPEFGYMISGDEMISNFDMGIDIGARVNISNKFNAGLRYSQGLPFKLKLDKAESSGYEPSYNNSVFQIYLGFNLVNDSQLKEKNPE